MDAGRRSTLGFFINDLEARYQQALWSAAEAEAHRRNANLICFAGGNLNDPTLATTPRNVLYDLAAAAKLDGLIISNVVGTYLSPDDYIAFCRRYRSLPIVSIAQSVPGVPSVLTDNSAGMRALLDHLIEFHGYRRLAFICGPPGNPEAEMRYSTYRAALAEHGIPFEAELVVPGDFTYLRGREAVRYLFAERRLAVEAIAAANDEMALGALDALKAQGWRVPDDVAVVGFDDIETADVVLPPLTTVRQPVAAQGRQAVELLLAILAGNPPPAETFLETEVVVRQSCGCQSYAGRQAAVNMTRQRQAPAKNTLGLDSPSIRAEICRAVDTPMGTAAAELVENLLTAFEAELRGERSGAFLQTLNSGLLRAVVQDRPVSVWQEAISIMRHYALPLLMCRPELWLRADNLWQAARVLIGSLAQLSQGQQWLKAERRVSRLNELSLALLTTFDLHGLVEVIAPAERPERGLAGLGILSAFLTLYENSRAPLEHGWLLMAYTEHGRIEVPRGGRRFPASQLVPPEYLPPERRYSYVVQPLYFRTEQLGFILLETGPRDGREYERLRDQLSTALEGALLVQQVLDKTREAERANQAKSEFLSRMSHELRTPLNSILGFAQLMEMETLPAEQIQHVRHIFKAAKHLLALINEVLDISRIESGRPALIPEPVHLQTILLETLELVYPLAVQANVILSPALLPDTCDCYVWADRQRLKQVLLNLLSNGIKYNRAGGTLTLNCAIPAADRLRLEFTDCGYGLPPEKMARLFTPFERLGAEQSSVEGTGLGLVLSKHLIEAMQGAIGVESRVGWGSTFWIELCRVGAPEHMSETPPPVALPPPAPAGTTRTVLYVEDNVANIHLIRSILAYRPRLRLIDVMQGRLALDMAGQHRPDLILLDLNLPDLPGEDVLERLKADSRTRDIPVVIISGEAVPARVQQLRAAGAREYLTKPIDVHHFLTLIDDLFKDQAAGLAA